MLMLNLPVIIVLCFPPEIDFDTSVINFIKVDISPLEGLYVISKAHIQVTFIA